MLLKAVKFGLVADQVEVIIQTRGHVARSVWAHRVADMRVRSLAGSPIVNLSESIPARPL